ncbi:hypothetical protein VYU27_001319 [Nannochloropsis oceanica]
MALEWLTLHKLGGDEDSPPLSNVWAACEETRTCLEGGLLRRNEDGSTAESLLAWLLETGHVKSVPQARLGAFHLLSVAIVHCPATVLSANLDKLTQLLRSGMSPASSPVCRVFACRAVGALVDKAWADGGEIELKQHVQQDILSRLVTSLLGCCTATDSASSTPTTANDDDDDEGNTSFTTRSTALAANIDLRVHTTALRTLAKCAHTVGMGFKSHAAKMEAAAYASLNSPSSADPSFRQAAIACLVRVPFTYSDGGHWTAMLLTLLGEAARTLKQVWPEAHVPSSLLQMSSSCSSSSGNNKMAASSHVSTHKMGLSPFPPLPEKGGGAVVKSYALAARARIQACLEAVATLLTFGHHHGSSPVLLPSLPLLGMCEVLLSSMPRGNSNLGATPAALPATALQALQPLLRSFGLDLLSSYLSAASSSAHHYLSRIAHLVLRALSWPVALGFRSRACALFSQVVLVMGASAAPSLVEPALLLLTHHASLHLFSTGTPLLVNSTMAAAPVISEGAGSKKKKGGALTKTATVRGREGGMIGEVLEMGTQGIEEVERVGIAVFKALETALLGCGPLLSMEGRLSLEQVVGAGLSDLNRGVPRPGAAVSSMSFGGISWVRRNAPLRAAFLGLAARALLIPRRDGAGSALTPLAARVFGVLCLDSDEGVARAALLGRAVAETITHPRAAPLFIPAALLKLDEEEDVLRGHAIRSAELSFPCAAASAGEGERGGGRKEEGEAAVAGTKEKPSLPFPSMDKTQVAAVWSQKTSSVIASSAVAAVACPAPAAILLAAEDKSKKAGSKRDLTLARSSSPSNRTDGGKRPKSAKAAMKTTVAVTAAAAQKEEKEGEEDEEDDLPMIVDDGGPDESEED